MARFDLEKAVKAVPASAVHAGDAIQAALARKHVQDITQRPSGWVCPNCHREMTQAYQEISIGQFRLLTREDGSPMPTAFSIRMVEQQEGGEPTLFTGEYCPNCVQQLEQYEQIKRIRASLKPLVPKEPDDGSASNDTDNNQ